MPFKENAGKNKTEDKGNLYVAIAYSLNLNHQKLIS